MELAALARLLRLASPTLPVGAFSYSQGLEAAVEQGWIGDESSACRWIGEVLRHSVARFEAPLWCRLYRAWAAGQVEQAAVWNTRFVAARESAEFRAESLQMGWALRRLLNENQEFSAEQLLLLQEIAEPAYPTVHAFAAAHWELALAPALTAYLWSWLENQTMAALKSVPLGQAAGQRLLTTLSQVLPALVGQATDMPDERLSNFSPLLAIASCRHETQYSRLFRS